MRTLITTDATNADYLAALERVMEAASTLLNGPSYDERAVAADPVRCYLPYFVKLASAVEAAQRARRDLL
jgi:hypothetical protein